MEKIIKKETKPWIQVTLSGSSSAVCQLVDFKVYGYFGDNR